MVERGRASSGSENKAALLPTPASGAACARAWGPAAAPPPAQGKRAHARAQTGARTLAAAAQPASVRSVLPARRNPAAARRAKAAAAEIRRNGRRERKPKVTASAAAINDKDSA